MIADILAGDIYIILLMFASVSLEDITRLNGGASSYTNNS